MRHVAEGIITASRHIRRHTISEQRYCHATLGRHVTIIENTPQHRGGVRGAMLLVCFHYAACYVFAATPYVITPQPLPPRYATHNTPMIPRFLCVQVADVIFSRPLRQSEKRHTPRRASGMIEIRHYGTRRQRIERLESR